MRWVLLLASYGVICGADARVAHPAKILHVYQVPKTFTLDILRMPLDQVKHDWTQWYDSDQVRMWARQQQNVPTYACPFFMPRPQCMTTQSDASTSGLLLRALQPEGSPDKSGWMQVLHKYLEKHGSEAADSASVFFIPIYTGRHYHSLLVEGGLSHADALNRTTALVSEAIAWVRNSFPYWNRTNGANHFMVFPSDHGRCHALAGAHAQQFGDLAAIQTAGDILIKEFKTTSWHCYRPGRDLVIPCYQEETVTMRDLVAPEATQRNITVLYRFSAGGRGNYGDVRTALLEQHTQNPIPGAVAGWATREQTVQDMRHAIFCVNPPGIAQQTIRLPRSIQNGCIPVTLFKANDSPYERLTSIDYRKFTVNINPDEVHLLKPMLEELLAKPDKVLRMQRALMRVQRSFVWDMTAEGSVQETVLRTLTAGQD